MEPFSITCETCHARLKVRSASAVGEIHACPKCGSMVHIVPPAAQATTPAETLVTPAAIVDVAAPLAEPAPAGEAAPQQVSFVDAAPTPAPVAITTPPLMLWSIGGAALLLVSGIAVGLWSGSRSPADDSRQVAAASAPHHEDSQPAAGDQHEVLRAVDEPVEIEPLETAKPHVEQMSQTASDQLPELPELPTEETEATEQAPLTAPPPSDRVPPSQPLPPPASATQAAAVLNIDPLDFDPDRLSLTRGGTAATTPAASIDEDAADAELPIEKPADDLHDNSVPPEVAAPTLHVRLGPMPGEGARSQQLDEQLQIAVQSLQVSDMPLQQFVGLISDMAGVPITLDPLALELAGVSPRQTVSVQAKDTTLDALLRDALAKYRLDFVEEQGQLRTVLRGGGHQRAVDYDVDDLVDAGDGARLADLTTRFVAPTTWQSAGGTATITVNGRKLRVEQTVAVHHQILIFFERLRLARGLPTRSRYPAERLSIHPPHTELLPRLVERTTFTFLPWTRLTDVLRHWEEASGLAILVDWSALADVGLGPTSPVACSAIDRTWQDALDGILEPLGLAWWAVDGDTIQITTREALDDIHRIAFYALPAAFVKQFANDDALIDALEAHARKADRSAADHLRLQRDDPSGRLIVLGSPATHRIYMQLFAE